jgi:small subunit ribosomal protein S1
MNDERDFGDILADFERQQTAGAGSGKDPEPGARVSGPILSIGEESAFVDLGGKSDGVVALLELTDADGELTVAVGDTVEGVVAGRDPASGGLRLRVRPGAGAGAADTALAIEELAQAHAHGIPIEGVVSEVVKGGVEVTVSGVRAFCPISQLERGFIEDAAAYVGRRLAFRVLRFEAAGRGGRPNVVLSRRDLLEEEERRRREEALARLAVGAVVRGTVTSVTAYGAFVDLGGIEGLLHVSEMAHERVERPADLVAPGDVLEVKVLSIEEREGKEGKDRRISLSRRALEQDPWDDAETRFPEGGTFPGRVMRLEPYGAFVRLAPGLEGLVHVSELAPGRRIAHPREVVSLGADVEVRVLGVDPAKRRIALTLAASAETEEGAAVEAYDERPDAPSGFGSMADFFDPAKK